MLIVVALERREPRCRGSGPQVVVILDQPGRDRSELGVEVVEVSAESVALELVLDSPGHKTAQAAAANVFLDAAGQILVDAYRPLPYGDDQILLW